MAHYAGDLPSKEAWDLLALDLEAVLVDVRTDAEWNFVGIPDLSKISKSPILLQWLAFPDSDLNEQFGGQLEATGIHKDTTLLFLCRSGQRSAAAASLMTGRGFTRCFNISDGFEGNPNNDRHRSANNGWKYSGLPWTQS